MEKIKARSNLEFFVGFLKPLLNKIFENVDLDIIIHEEGTIICIRDVILRKDIFKQNNIPLEFLKGKVSEIKLEILNLLTLSPIRLEINGIKAQIQIVRLNENYQSKFISMRENILSTFDEIHKHIFLPNFKKISTFLEKILQQVENFLDLQHFLENFQLKISNLTFAVVDSNEQVDKKKLKQLELKISEINSNFKIDKPKPFYTPNDNYDKSSNKTKKKKTQTPRDLLDLSNIEDDESEENDGNEFIGDDSEEDNQNSSEQNKEEEQLKENDSINNNEPKEPFRKLIRSIIIKKISIYLSNAKNTNLDMKYLLTPLLSMPSLEVTLIMTPKNPKDNISINNMIQSQWFFNIRLKVKSITMNVSKHKITFLINMINNFLKVDKISSYWRYRPATNVNKIRDATDAKKFLRYAFLSIRAKMRIKRMDNVRGYYFKQAVNMERYYQCYSNSKILLGITPPENAINRIKLLEKKMRIIHILHCKEEEFRKLLKERKKDIKNFEKVEQYYDFSDDKWLKLSGKKNAIRESGQRIKQDEIIIDFMKGEPNDKQLELKLFINLICINFTRTVSSDKKGPIEIPSQLEYYHNIYRESMYNNFNKDIYNNFNVMKKLERLKHDPTNTVLDKAIKEETSARATKEVGFGKQEIISQRKEYPRKNNVNFVGITHRLSSHNLDSIPLSGFQIPMEPNTSTFSNEKNEKKDDIKDRNKFLEDIKEFFYKKKYVKIVTSVILTNIGGKMFLQRDKFINFEAKVVSFDIIDYNYLYVIANKNNNTLLRDIFEKKFESVHHNSSQASEEKIFDQEDKSETIEIKLLDRILMSFLLDCLKSNQFRNLVIGEYFLIDEGNFLNKCQNNFNFKKSKIFEGKNDYQITQIFTGVLMNFLYELGVLNEYNNMIINYTRSKNYFLDNLNEFNPDLFIRIFNKLIKDNGNKYITNKQLYDNNFEEVILQYESIGPNRSSILEEIEDDLSQLLKFFFVQICKSLVSSLMPYFFFEADVPSLFTMNMLNYAHKQYKKEKIEKNCSPFVSLVLNKNGIIPTNIENKVKVTLDNNINLRLSTEIIAEIVPVAMSIVQTIKDESKIKITGNIYEELSTTHMDTYDEFCDIIQDFNDAQIKLYNSTDKSSDLGENEINYVKEKEGIIKFFNENFMNVELSVNKLNINLLDKVFLISSEKINVITVYIDNLKFNSKKLKELPIKEITKKYEKDKHKKHSSIDEDKIFSSRFIDLFVHQELTVDDIQVYINNEEVDIVLLKTSVKMNIITTIFPSIYFLQNNLIDLHVDRLLINISPIIVNAIKMGTNLKYYMTLYKNKFKVGKEHKLAINIDREKYKNKLTDEELFQINNEGQIKSYVKEIGTKLKYDFPNKIYFLNRISESILITVGNQSKEDGINLFFYTDSFDQAKSSKGRRTRLMDMSDKTKLFFAIRIPLVLFSLKKCLFYEEMDLWMSQIRTDDIMTIIDGKKLEPFLKEIVISFNSNQYAFNYYEFIFAKYFTSALNKDIDDDEYIRENQLEGVQHKNLFETKNFSNDEKEEEKKLKLNLVFSKKSFYYETQLGKYYKKFYNLSEVNSSLNLDIDNILFVFLGKGLCNFSKISVNFIKYLSSSDGILKKMQNLSNKITEEGGNEKLKMEKKEPTEEINTPTSTKNPNEGNNYHVTFGNEEVKPESESNKIKNIIKKINPHKIYLCIKGIEIKLLYKTNNHHILELEDTGFIILLNGIKYEEDVCGINRKKENIFQMMKQNINEYYKEITPLHGKIRKKFTFGSVLVPATAYKEENNFIDAIPSKVKKESLNKFSITSISIFASIKNSEDDICLATDEVRIPNPDKELLVVLIRGIKMKQYYHVIKIKIRKELSVGFMKNTYRKIDRNVEVKFSKILLSILNEDQINRKEKTTNETIEDFEKAESVFTEKKKETNPSVSLNKSIKTPKSEDDDIDLLTRKIAEKNQIPQQHCHIKRKKSYYKKKNTIEIIIKDDLIEDINLDTKIESIKDLEIKALYIDIYKAELFYLISRLIKIIQTIIKGKEHFKMKIDIGVIYVAIDNSLFSYIYDIKKFAIEIKKLLEKEKEDMNQQFHSSESQIQQEQQQQEKQEEEEEEGLDKFKDLDDFKIKTDTLKGKRKGLMKMNSFMIPRNSNQFKKIFKEPNKQSLKKEKKNEEINQAKIMENIQKEKSFTKGEKKSLFILRIPLIIAVLKQKYLVNRNELGLMNNYYLRPFAMFIVNKLLADFKMEYNKELESFILTSIEFSIYSLFWRGDEIRCGDLVKTKKKKEETKEEDILINFSTKPMITGLVDLTLIDSKSQEYDELKEFQSIFIGSKSKAKEREEKKYTAPPICTLNVDSIIFVFIFKCLKEIILFFEKNTKVLKDELDKETKKKLKESKPKCQSLVGINLENSSMILPEDSRSANYLCVNIKSASIKILMDDITPSIVIPPTLMGRPPEIIDIKSIFDVNIIKFINDNNKHFVPHTIANIETKNVDAFFCINNKKSSKILMNELTLRVKAPKKDDPLTLVRLEDFDRAYNTQLYKLYGKGKEGPPPAGKTKHVVMYEPKVIIIAKDGDVDAPIGYLMSMKNFIENNIEEESLNEYLREPIAENDTLELNATVENATIGLELYKVWEEIFPKKEGEIIEKILPGYKEKIDFDTKNPKKIDTKERQEEEIKKKEEKSQQEISMNKGERKNDDSSSSYQLSKSPGVSKEEILMTNRKNSQKIEFLSEEEDSSRSEDSSKEEESKERKEVEMGDEFKEKSSGEEEEEKTIERESNGSNE